MNQDTPGYYLYYSSQRWWWLLLACWVCRSHFKMASWAAADRALCFSRGESNACLFVAPQLIAVPLHWNMYPDVDLLSFKHPPQSASEKPTQPPFSLFRYSKPSLVVPLRYLRMRLTPVQCCLVGSEQNLAMFPTANAKSGLVFVDIGTVNCQRLPDTSSCLQGHCLLFSSQVFRRCWRGY